MRKDCVKATIFAMWVAAGCCTSSHFTDLLVMSKTCCCREGEKRLCGQRGKKKRVTRQREKKGGGKGKWKDKLDWKPYWYNT